MLPLQIAAKSIYNHWKERRLQNGGKSINPALRFEETGMRNDADPYVCFRRRETKPVRKTRRTDQQSLEKLRKLRAEMETARNLLEMVLRREKMRKESLALEHTVFDKKCVLRDMQRQLGIKEDEDLLFSKKKRKMSTESGSGLVDKFNYFLQFMLMCVTLYSSPIFSFYPCLLHLSPPKIISHAERLSKFLSTNSNVTGLIYMRNRLLNLLSWLKLRSERKKTVALKILQM